MGNQLKKDLKQEIIDTALQLFQAHGYNGVSVNQIVAQAGTSKGGFYHHFKAKDELLYEIHDIFITYVLEEAKKTEEHYTTPIAKLCALLHSFTAAFHTYQAHITVFYDESKSLLDSDREVITQKRDAYRKILQQVIVDGQQSGDFREALPPTIVTLSITGMVNWSYKWYKQDGTMTMTQITDIFIDMILRSIVTQQGAEEAKHYSIESANIDAGFIF